MAKSRGLGKGLQALIPKLEKIDENEDFQQKDIINISIGKIMPNSKQPRKNFDQEKLRELADSILENGIIQPIVVRKKDQKFELVAGERRWRASQLINLDVIPAIIKEVSDDKMAELALIENIQREDLNPIDEAKAYKQLLSDFKLTQEELSKRVGKSRSFIANMIRILNLSQKIQGMVAQGDLSIGHARALLGIDDRTLQIVIAEKVIKNQLSVRQTEEVVKSISDDNGQVSDKQKPKEIKIDPIIMQTEDKLKDILGTKVKIKHSGKRGKIEIEFYNDDDFNRILDLVMPGEEF